MEILIEEMDSPIGEIVLAGLDGRLCALDFGDCREWMTGYLKSRFGEFSLRSRNTNRDWRDRIGAYLEGEFTALDGIEVDVGGTVFQNQVWSALCGVAPGTTSTYGGLAATIGRPKAARAVGAACGRNPVALVVPCHRAVGHDGSLTGFAGGLPRKRWLLQHEGVAC